MPEKFSVSIGIIRGSPGRWRAKTLSMYTTRQSSVFGYIGTFDTITSSTAYVVLMSFWIFTSEADNFCPRRQQNIRNKIPPTVFRARPSSKTPLTPRPTLLRPGADQMLIWWSDISLFAGWDLNGTALVRMFIACLMRSLWYSSLAQHLRTAYTEGLEYRLDRCLADEWMLLSCARTAAMPSTLVRCAVCVARAHEAWRRLELWTPR